MAGLKLDAMDADDLQLLSAYCQDAITIARDCRFLGREGRFVVAINRFLWESAQTPSRWRFLKKPQYERRRAILDFGRVGAVRANGIAPGSGDVLSLLAIRFTPGAEPPNGSIELVFAGDATIRLEVECVEARLTDGEAAWSTERRPDHDKPNA